MSMLVMITDRGFYPVEAVPFYSLQKQAADHGELNQHVKRVEDVDGNILWERLEILQ